jgi:hypothetical protein
MFSRRRVLDRRRKYTCEFFESFIQRLSEAGFNDISIVLPHNYSSVDPTNSIISVPDFLSRERNYAAIIVKAKSTDKDELMKILLVNSTATAIFLDDTFPSAVSEPPTLYFQSPDPARAYALFEYFYELLSEASLAGFVFLSIAGLISIVTLLTEVLVFTSKKSGLLSYFFSWSNIWDYMLMALSVWLAYSFYKQPTGLWIKPHREFRILYLLKMAIRGEYRDNPIVQLIVTILGGLIVAVLVKLLGIL